MRKYLLIFLLMLGLTATARATVLSGTIKDAGGNLINGTLTIRMEKSGIRNTCVTPSIIVPITPVVIKIARGVIQGSVDIIPTDCLNITQPYLAEVRDNSHIVIMAAHWWITQSGGGALYNGAGSVVSDTFDGATLGTNWTTVGGAFVITSNRIRGNNAGGVRSATYYNGTFSNDQFARLTVASIAGTGIHEIGPAVRVNGPGGGTNSFYQLAISNGTWFVDRMVNSLAAAFVASGSTTVAIGDILELDVIGTTLTAKKNGVVLGSGTDSGIASGNPGVYAEAGTGGTNAQSGDNFYAGPTSVLVGNSFLSDVGLGITSFGNSVAFSVPSVLAGFKNETTTTSSILGGSTAIATLTWQAPFPNANYVVVCSLSDSLLAPLQIVSSTASSVTVFIMNSGTLRSGTLRCLAKAS